MGVSSPVFLSPIGESLCFCLLKRKWPNKRAPRCRLFPSVLAPHLRSDCGTRPLTSFSLRQTSPHIHLLAQAEGTSKGFESQNPLFSTVILSETKNPVVRFGFKSWILRYALNDGLRGCVGFQPLITLSSADKIRGRRAPVRVPQRLMCFVSR